MAGKGGEPFVCAGGTLVRTDRVAARTEAGNHLWYSRFAQGLRRQHAGPDRSHGVPGVDRAHGAGLDPFSSPPHAPMLYQPCTGRPRWGCPPWQTRAAPAPASASRSRPRTPPRTPTPDSTGELITSMRAPAERANALLKFPILLCVPVPAASLPATGTMVPRGAVVTLLCTAVGFLALSRLIWKCGLRRYVGGAN